MFGWNKIIDVEEFKDLLGHQREALDSLIVVFSEQSKATIDDLNKAINSSNRFDYERATHDLKIIGRHLACKRIIKQADELQQIAQITLAKKYLEGTQRLIEQALEELKALQTRWK